MDLIIRSFQYYTASQKAIAGLTQQFYQKFKGQEQLIFDKGGITDDEAKALAQKLHGYLRQVSFIRDQGELDDFKEKLASYPHKDKPREREDCDEENKENCPWKHPVETIDDIPNDFREEFVEWIRENNSGSKADHGFVTKTITGVDDDSILDTIEIVPTILAMSQVTYFYNEVIF